MPSRPPLDDSGLPQNDKQRSKEELLKELRKLRRQYVNLKILEFEHDKAVAALKESEDKYRQIVETANDIIYRTDARGYFTYANHAAVRIIGYPLKEIIGKNYLDLIHTDYRKRAMRHYAVQTRDRIASTYFEFPAVKRSGSIVWLGQNVQLITQGKRIIELQAVARDVTDIKNAEEKRGQLESQLRQAQKMESVGTLAGGIAHDFNNILGIILAHVSILDHPDLPERQRLSSLESISKTVARAKGMVRELLTLARRTEPTFEYLDVNRAIEEFNTVIQGTFPRSISFKTDCAADLPGIDADSNQFHQLLLNLYVNARDAMPSGGTIEVSTERCNVKSKPGGIKELKDGSYVKLCVKDTGVGMDEFTRSRVFEPFFSTKEHGKGSGLGLAVVYGIMESHHGTIEVESAPGRGSAFSLYFPIGTLGLAPVLGHEPVIGDAMETGTILVVEDEDLLRGVIVGALKERGHTVFEATDGIEAVDTFMSHHGAIDLVLSDISLPKLGGWEACVTMREIKPEVPIILASGFVDPQLRNEITGAGKVSFILKPYVPEEVLRNIGSMLRISRRNS